MNFALLPPQHWFGLAALAAIIVAVILLKKRGSKQRVALPPRQPAWKMTSRLQGALLAPTRSIYSTHIQRGAVAAVEYNKKEYKVISQQVVTDPRALCYGGKHPMGTDITILNHEPVTEVEPVKLVAADPRLGDPLVCYFPSRTVKTKVGFVSETIVYNAGAVPGDSSSPVANEHGELVTLNSMDHGYGPNLFRIRDILFDGLQDKVSPIGE